MDGNSKKLSDMQSELTLFTSKIERRQGEVDSMTKRIIATSGGNIEKVRLDKTRLRSSLTGSQLLLAVVQVLTDSNLSILGDMVKSLSKRAIKQQSSVEQLTQELTQCKGESLHHSPFSCLPWRLTSLFLCRPMPGVLAAHHGGRRAGHDSADGGAGDPGEGQEGQEKIVVGVVLGMKHSLSSNTCIFHSRTKTRYACAPSPVSPVMPCCACALSPNRCFGDGGQRRTCELGAPCFFTAVVCSATPGATGTRRAPALAPAQTCPWAPVLAPAPCPWTISTVSRGDVTAISRARVLQVAASSDPGSVL
eukprot:COSAG04_NODE_2667_length_3762_cov_170.003822_5_plen_307_part_00